MLRSVAPLLLEQGYDIKVFNLIEPHNSDGYNPFVYIKNDEDVIKLITNLIQNTTPKNAQQNDPFWEKSEIALDTALMLYLLHEAPPEEQNFETLMFLIENAATVEDDEDNYQSPVDLLFEGLEEENPEHIAVKQYKIFKQASGKTAKSILISAAVRLAAFNLPEIAKMTSYDNLDIGTLGEKKRAIFCVIPDNDNSFNYLVGMLYTQAFQALYYNADHKHGGELPIPVHILMDEFANVALPDNFERILATMRSRRISVSIIIQNMAQLKALFKDSWENITGNCDTLLYLGGNEQATHEYISKMLGKETIDTRTRGITKGQHGSSNTNYQNAGRELLTLDEVRLLDNSNALIFVRGERPVIDKKFDIMSHPNVAKTADGKAAPYKHSKDSKLFRSDLSFEFNEDISNIVFDLEEGKILSKPTSSQSEVLKAQTNDSGIAVFYTVLESRTDEKGIAEVCKYVVAVNNVSKETTPVANALVKYTPASADNDGKIIAQQEITVSVDESIVAKGGQMQIAVTDKESGQYVKDIKIRFITTTTTTTTTKSEEKQTKTETETNSSNGGKLKCVNLIRTLIQRLKKLLTRSKK